MQNSDSYYLLIYFFDSVFGVSLIISSNNDSSLLLLIVFSSSKILEALRQCLILSEVLVVFVFERGLRLENDLLLLGDGVGGFFCLRIDFFWREELCFFFVGS